MEKVTNPLTSKKITIGAKIYNDLIKSGYILVNGNLVKPSEDIENVYESEEYPLESEESEESGEYYQSESESEESGEKSKKSKYYEEEYDMPEEGEYKFVEYSGEKRPIYQKRDIEIPSFDLPPVRCIQCNKPIAILHKKYVALREEGMEPIEIYKQLRLNRPCCRMNITHVPKEYLYTEEKEVQKPAKTKSVLSKNPYFKPKEQPRNEAIRLYQGGQFEGIKNKVTFGPENEYVTYEKFTTPELLRKQQIGRGKYYISYSK